MAPDLKIVLAAVMVIAALCDLRTVRVPNWLTLPLMGAGALYSALVLRSGWFLIPWALLYGLWYLGAFGAGDAKLMMGLFALTPPGLYRELSLCLAGATGLAGLVFGIREYGGLLPFLLGCLNVLQGRISPEALEKARRPFTWAYSVGALWFLFAVA